MLITLMAITSLLFAEGHEGQSVYPLPEEVTARLKQAGVCSWEENCPATLDELAYLQIPYWTLDGEVAMGEMVVHKEIQERVLGAFSDLFQAQFPIAKMRLIDEEGITSSIHENNTSAFCARASCNDPNRWSTHSFGLAIDINPKFNPHYSWTEGVVFPEESEEFLDRTREDVPGMIRKGDACYQAFVTRGFEWGGEGNDSSVEYQHFVLSPAFLVKEEELSKPTIIEETFIFSGFGEVEPLVLVEEVIVNEGPAPVLSLNEASVDTCVLCQLESNTAEQ